MEQIELQVEDILERLQEIERQKSIPNIIASGGGTETTLAKTPGGGIAGSTGTGPWTLGNATCTKCEVYDDSGTIKAREISPAVNITVYNSTDQTIAASVLIQCKKINGRWFVDAASCT